MNPVILPEKSIVVGLDPGNEHSGIVVLRGGRVDYHAKLTNGDTRSTLQAIKLDAQEEGQLAQLAVEKIASYGMAVGQTVFDTCEWCGAFKELWGLHAHGVYRREVKMHLCGSTRAKDANIRQALIDRFGPSKEEAIGRKATPGPLYGFKGDEWAALGVALTFWETKCLLNSERRGDIK